jgi:hypothetical protein
MAVFPQRAPGSAGWRLRGPIPVNMYSNIANLDHKVGADRAEVHQLICGNILAGVDEERPEHLAWPLVDTQHEIIAVAVELDFEVGAFDVVIPWDAGLESHHLVVPQISAHRSTCRHGGRVGAGRTPAAASKKLTWVRLKRRDAA